REPASQVGAFRAGPGGGVTAQVAGRAVVVGTRTLVAAEGVPADALAELEPDLQRIEATGRTAMLVAVDGTVAGLLGVADTVKVGSAEAVARLQEQGIAVWMLTGDNRRTAQALAGQGGNPAGQVPGEGA